MKGNDFIRKIRKLGRKNNVPVELDAERGKGSHSTLTYGDRFTIVRNTKDELACGTLHAIVKATWFNIKRY